MPFQRRSCDACFNGRRKCDLAFPTCGRCQRNRKVCRYVSMQTPESTASEASSSPANCLAATAAVPSAGLGAWDLDLAFGISLNDAGLMQELIRPSIPNMVGELGDLQPVTGNTRSWTWVIEQLRRCPHDFARRVENVFVHKALVRRAGSGPLRTCFGICAACTCMTEANKFMVYDALNAEMSKLTNCGTSNGSLEESLAALQAIVLYQIIRLFYGDAKQRTLAENQKSHIAAMALQLLRRASNDLQDAHPAWENWLITESVRRTVMVAFIGHGVYAIFKYGVCPEVPTLSVLPLSSKQAFWHSQGAYLNHYAEDETIKYSDFASLWTVSSPRKLEPFEKMLLVACKGIESVEAFTPSSENQA